MSPSQMAMLEAEARAQAQATPEAQAETDVWFHGLKGVDLPYLETSERYEIKGGFTAEVIQNPAIKFLEKGMMGYVIRDLRRITLAAFEKDESQSEQYTPDEVMRKNAIFVDWLVVVRKAGRLVAYGSASYISNDLIYLNGAMVVPDEQVTGIGVVANSLLWKTAVEFSRRRGAADPVIVGRTHNRNVASVLLHIFRDAKLSTERDLSDETYKILNRTSEYLHCSIHEQTGISYDVYPKGLPAGSKTKNERINEGFERVGSRDACYVIGKLDDEHVQRMLKRQVTIGWKTKDSRPVPQIAHKQLTLSPAFG